MSDQFKFYLAISIFAGVLLLVFFIIFLVNKRLAVVFAVIVLLYVSVDKYRPIVVNNQELQSSRLTKTYKIVQVSDFHSSSYRRARQIINSLERIKPDIVCFTGDIWEQTQPIERHGSVDMLLAEISKRFSTYFVNGNHDDRIVPSNALNEVVFDPSTGFYDFRPLPNGIELGEIFLNGVGIGAKKHAEIKTSGSKLNIVLAHYPTMAEDLLKTNPFIDLVLAGDTHGGQIRLPFLGAILAFRMTILPEWQSEYRGLVRGLVKIDTDRGKRIQPTEGWLDSGQFIYVCSGAGYNGDSIRFLCPAQISLINIHPSK